MVRRSRPAGPAAIRGLRWPAELAGGGRVGGELNRAGVLVAGRKASLPVDVALEGMTAAILVDHLLFGDMGRKLISESIDGKLS